MPFLPQNEVPTVEYVSPADLKVDGQNPNVMKPKQLEALRLCIMDIDPRYCQVILDRWQAYTGQKAEGPLSRK